MDNKIPPGNEPPPTTHTQSTEVTPGSKPKGKFKFLRWVSKVFGSTSLPAPPLHFAETQALPMIFPDENQMSQSARDSLMKFIELAWEYKDSFPPEQDIQPLHQAIYEAAFLDFDWEKRTVLSCEEIHQALQQLLTLSKQYKKMEITHLNTTARQAKSLSHELKYFLKRHPLPPSPESGESYREYVDFAHHFISATAHFPVLPNAQSRIYTNRAF